MQPLPGLTAFLLCQAVHGVSMANADRWAAPLNAACRKYEITRSLRRIAAFLGHIAQESGSLSHLTENPNYRADKILGVFSAFKTEEEAKAYAHRPEAFANKAYANRNGNGDEASGDGWRYRGRGFIQLTFKDNYAAFSREFKVDAVKDPDLVASPQYAALSAASYSKKRRLNELADAQMYEALSKHINKSLTGFPAREQKRKRALDVLSRATLASMTISLSQGWFGGFQ